MTRQRKPLGWPTYMVAKRLSNGRVAYYWQPPTWAKSQGCPVRAEAVGTDYGEAKRRCDELLNPQFEAWRKREEPQAIGSTVSGTFDWLVGVFKSSPKFRRLSPGSRADYDRALGLLSSHVLKDGRRFGVLSLKSITPGVADRLHEKILSGGKGDRFRTAKLCMDVARRAWAIAYRDKPSTVPSANPFARMGISYKPRSNRAATLAELKTFVAKADELGWPSIGTAAMIGFYWLQREEDIFLRLTWSDYRPTDTPERVLIWHNKNHGERLSLPLYDEDGTDLWPELTGRLDFAARRGTLMIMRDTPDRSRGVYLPWATSASNPVRHVQTVVRNICKAASLPRELTFTSFRHGGHTDGADAELSDAQMRALGGHKTTAALLRYAKDTDKQRRTGARKRLNARTKSDALSE